MLRDNLKNPALAFLFIYGLSILAVVVMSCSVSVYDASRADAGVQLDAASISVGQDAGAGQDAQ